MKNIDVIKSFLQKTPARTLNLHTETDGDKFILVNYEQPIAYIQGGDLWLDQCKYSSTTSTLQGQLAYYAQGAGYNIMHYNQGKINVKGYHIYKSLKKREV